MSEYTQNYGALSSISDPRKTLTTTDSTGTEFIFEVNQLDIQETEIREYEKTLGANRWLIWFNTILNVPSDTEISKALENGLIIKLSFKVTTYDNYGIRHMLRYNPSVNKYVFDITYYSIENIKSIIPFDDSLIKFIKEGENITELKIQYLNNTIRLYNSYMYDIITELKNTNKRLEERIKILENK
jgi:hypothetical protein